LAKSALDKAREAPGSTKGRILAAAEEVFAARGFEGASTREIAARADVNISSLHYHWESKETLYFAVFRNIYDRLMEISRTAIAPAARRDPGRDSGRILHEESLGRLFDFFSENPNIPRLLLRRILENEEFGEEIERDILAPSWQTFAGWVREYSGKKIKDIDAQIFMLTLHSTMLLFTLDSRQYAHILGGRIHDAEIARRIRTHVIQLSTLLIGTQPKA
jgi:AcrR family transcriptional regulator